MLSLEWLGWVTMHSISLAHNSCHANELILFGHVFVWFCCCTVWVKWSCNIAVLGTVSRPGLLWWPLPFVVSQSWLSSHTSRSEMRPQGWGSKVVWVGEDLLFFTIRLWMADLWCSSCLCCALTHIQSAKELSPLKNLKRLKKKSEAVSEVPGEKGYVWGWISCYFTWVCSAWPLPHLHPAHDTQGFAGLENWVRRKCSGLGLLFSQHQRP